MLLKHNQVISVVGNQGEHINGHHFRELPVSNGHRLEWRSHEFQSNNEQNHVLKTHAIVLTLVHSHHLILHVAVLSNLEMV